MTRHTPDPAWRAALLQAIAQGFHYPAPGHDRRVRAALARLAEQAPAGASPALRRALRRAAGRWRGIATDALAAEYSRLYLNQVPCPMHETAYAGPGGVAGRTREIADVAGFYLAFGLRIAEAGADRPDHLCAELEFMSALLLKWAHAGARGWRERRRIAAHAARAFLNDHLGRWHGAFAARLSESGALPAYRALGGLLALALRAECRAWRVRPVPPAGAAEPDCMQADALVCPRAAATCG